MLQKRRWRDDGVEEDEDEDDHAEDEVADGRTGPTNISGCKLAGQERP